MLQNLQFKCNEHGAKWCSIKRVTKLAVAKVSYPSRIPASMSNFYLDIVYITGAYALAFFAKWDRFSLWSIAVPLGAGILTLLISWVRTYSLEVPWYIGLNPPLWIKGLQVRFPSMPGTFVLQQDILSTLLLSTQVYKWVPIKMQILFVGGGGGISPPPVLRLSKKLGLIRVDPE